MTEKLAYVVQVDKDGNIIQQGRAPAENMIAPQPVNPNEQPESEVHYTDIPFAPDNNNLIPSEPIAPPPFYETPLFMGCAIFGVLILALIVVLKIKGKK